jgi:IclR family mhp operon transcriptional activator
MSVHRRLVGKTRPLLRSALGLAYLSALSRSDLLHTLDVASRVSLTDPSDLEALENIEQRIDAVHRKGYADSVGLVEENISAIALPVRLGRKPVGAMNIAFFRSALTPAAAAEAHLDQLRDTIAKAEAALAVQARS